MRSNVRPKVRRRKVAALAAYSRQFTVKNITETISPVVEHKRYGAKVDESMVITNPLSGNKFMQTNPHTITGKFGVSITAYDWVPLEEFKKNGNKLWEIPEGGFKQPKRLIKCKNRKYSKPYHVTKDGITHECTNRNKPTRKNEYEHTGHNDFVKFFPNYPYTIKPMCKTAYMEKLVAHKLEKWEKKHVKPQDMFTEDVEKWNNERFIAEQRFRDFVVSCYNKLELNGRFKETEQKYTEEKVAEIKDINGEGHHVNELNKDSKLLKKAQKITDETKKKKPNLVATNLKDHKKQKGRIILPAAA